MKIKKKKNRPWTDQDDPDTSRQEFSLATQLRNSQFGMCDVFNAEGEHGNVHVFMLCECVWRENTECKCERQS